MPERVLEAAEAEAVEGLWLRWERLCIVIYYLSRCKSLLAMSFVVVYSVFSFSNRGRRDRLRWSLQTHLHK